MILGCCVSYFFHCWEKVSDIQRQRCKGLFSSEILDILVHNKVAIWQGDIWQKSHSSWHWKTAKQQEQKQENKPLSASFICWNHGDANPINELIQQSLPLIPKPLIFQLQILFSFTFEKICSHESMKLCRTPPDTNHNK